MGLNLYEVVREAAGYMHRAYGEELTVADVAGKVYVSPAYFATVFRVLTGFSVKDYLNRYRLYRAAMALGESKRSVLAVALDCGFQSQQAFTRSFTRAYGVAPARFRKLGLEAKTFPPPDIFRKRGISMELKQAFEEVRFVTKESFLVVGVENDVYYSIGYDAIGRAYKRWKDEDLINRIPDQIYKGVTYGMTHESIYENMSKYLVGVEVSTLDNLPAGLLARRFPAAEFAVFRIVLDDEGKFWRHFYGTWLEEMGFSQPGMIVTQSNNKLPTLPNYEVYDETFVDFSSVVEIYAPVLR